ncbi:hypothetical protein SAMN05216272_106226 [Pseudomonas panipatensis]|uniref:Uncharacterized protein n=1 Tax=Pseudomonas panipatensis TaxID=428992 RepID=A0A1G8IFR4_9PSED|nr:hypothetical protein SAMN05216272_106226 [Pseudomonas panipatensis]SMP74119.1 hypothetical protein SAMN06295951_112142 [Pseudomonas panipatensis]
MSDVSTGGSLPCLLRFQRLHPPSLASPLR